MKQFIKAAASGLVIIIGSDRLKIDHFIAISLYRPRDSRRVAVVDTKLDYQAVGRVIVGVGCHVEIQQVCIAVFDRTGNARCAVIAAAACDYQRRAFVNGREKAVYSGCEWNIAVLYVCFSGQNISNFSFF